MNAQTQTQTQPRAIGGDASAPAIECTSLVRIYRTENLEVQALQGLDLHVAKGEFIALVGASGSGKSTLLGILSGHDSPSAGSVRVDGRELAGLSAHERMLYRRRSVGFLWQSPPRNLLPQLTAAQNVALPQRFNGIGRKARRARALDLLDSMGVADCRDRTPGHLSGGEQQRVAIAVALANSPAVLLADEPTGELDAESARHVISALREANVEHGVTTLIVTHDEEVAGQVRRTVAIRDGRIATETHRPGVAPGTEALQAADGSLRSDNADVEYAVIDRAGRLQLPPEFTEPLGIKNLVRLTREPGHIEVWPEHGQAGERGGSEPKPKPKPEPKPDEDEA